ncbi:hypothetical protein ASPSYDRAFT_93793 [Aspergillus sydowii CBS 593.65]|uniref:DUF7732 domain-containing protein n=1 Tax=Aspergillus sydowii CBS 593.65 TaxID=1036612 RepID=A0A1L9T3N3_9EURO|nr:uncharacterized protein ASPSYDRAFT_93793 [Aspergillus sydowii CBS 593.65]OJJ54028.1 hypothetical protein ASPSYDRAFT_93793 [Aspergillus sydowii CBS 593.65]
MKITIASAIALLLSTTVTSVAVPTSDIATRHSDIFARSHEDLGLEGRDLEKRRGGGGGGRGGGGGSGGGGGGRGGGGGSSSSGGRPSSGNHPATRPGSTSTTSNRGGTSPGGSGPRPSYGRGGGYYGGGAVAPYQSGIRSPLGVVPFFLPVAALAFFPGLWLYGAHVYPYDHHYNYTNDTNNRNESLPVICLCGEYAECGCDDNNNSTYYESLFNGTQPKNGSIVRVADVNGTQTIVINGTLPNGTTVDEAAVDSAAAMSVIQASGYWIMAAIVAGAVYTL